MKKWLLGAVLCVLLGSFVMLRAGRESPGNPQTSMSSFLEDVTIVQSRDGTAVWTLTARRADVLEEENVARLHSIAFTLPENHLTLTADEGAYDFSTQSFSTASIVEGRGDSFRITADSLDVDVSSGMIRTPGPVRLDGKAFSLEGRGMEAGRGETVRILGDVRATFER